MPKIYIERRPDGDYAVQVAGKKKASAIEPTQGDAIRRAREMYPDVKPMSKDNDTQIRASPTNGEKPNRQRDRKGFPPEMQACTQS
jgi:hypothetical protein